MDKTKKWLIDNLEYWAGEMSASSVWTGHESPITYLRELYLHLDTYLKEVGEYDAATNMETAYNALQNYEKQVYEDCTVKYNYWRDSNLVSTVLNAVMHALFVVAERLGIEVCI